MPTPLRRQALKARRKALNTRPNLLPFLITFAHVLLSPYTKVEESFSLHATHDVLTYGFSPSHYYLVCHTCPRMGFR